MSKIEKTCDWCGNTFLIESNKKTQKFCSISCGLKARVRFSPDINIFDKQNDTSVYILGLIWSDGNLYEGKGSPILDITTKEKDLMKRIHNIITPNKRLYQQAHKGACTTYSVKTRNQEIIQSLRNFGLTPAKSKTLDWPNNLDDRFLWSFIRGVFDGDGSVGAYLVNNRYGPYLRLSITGYRNNFMECLHNALDFLEPKWTQDRRHDNVWKINIYKKKNVYKFATKIYHGETICLLRKKQIFIENGWSI